ncbi:hypothetical protein ASD8599_00769 [Ascidiaceihabitans donghaensis]|uniref:GSCFA domain-containing protein n=1 Tax=Ascidiaceihabitans donghaensis TaxID=1510460 RepID=A0A2R8BAF5_9RHOB|nr:GSCFA domain-containing protein [Ascidiaceihabitans donghaensis]SPH20029.1 hypothetical protein ASD8599_00769 [Ascidiaceihabitans donghaensis]
MTDKPTLEQLWAQMRASEVSNWDGVSPRLYDQCAPSIRPRFKVPARSSVFTIGSCFARNIEENLGQLGYDLPMLKFDLPAEEKINSRAANIVNKYTPPAIYQEVKWCYDIAKRDGIVNWADCEAIAFEKDGMYYDTATHGRYPLSKERMLERRQHIFDVFKTMFQTDCVVITLGLTEVFRDVERDLYVSNALVAIGPLRRALGERLEFVDLDFETSLGFVRGALDLIWDMNPDARILITVSPVSAKATFSGDDIILASIRSKALLHTVITEVIRNEPRAGYFPGFERIMLTRSWDVFAPDLRHVSDFAVKGVVAQLVQTYFEVDATQRQDFEANIASAHDAEVIFNTNLVEGTAALEAEDFETAEACGQTALEQAIRNRDINNGELRALRIIDAAITARADWVARDVVLTRMIELRPHCVAWIKLAYNNYRLQRYDQLKSNIDMAKETLPDDHPSAAAQIEKLTEYWKNATGAAH